MTSITLMPYIPNGFGLGPRKVSVTLQFPNNLISVDLYQVNVGLPSPSDLAPSGLFNGARLYAIGDLDSDKQNDIVTVSEDGTKFSAHYFR